MDTESLITLVSTTATGVGHLQASITSQLTASVTVFGLPAPHLTSTTNIQDTHLYDYLTSLTASFICPGVATLPCRPLPVFRLGRMPIILIGIGLFSATSVHCDIKVGCVYTGHFCTLLTLVCMIAGVWVS